jgi:hypothetical protein
VEIGKAAFPNLHRLPVEWLSIQDPSETVQSQGKVVTDPGKERIVGRLEAMAGLRHQKIVGEGLFEAPLKCERVRKPMAGAEVRRRIPTQRFRQDAHGLGVLGEGLFVLPGKEETVRQALPRDPLTGGTRAKQPAPSGCGKGEVLDCLCCVTGAAKDPPKTVIRGSLALVPGWSLNALDSSPVPLLCLFQLTSDAVVSGDGGCVRPRLDTSVPTAVDEFGVEVDRLVDIGERYFLAELGF